VCADISLVALREARNRLGEKGLYVVADISRLPFKAGVFEGLVSLHTLHHLPPADHARAYGELFRVLVTGARGVIVNGWTDSALMRLAGVVVKPAEWLLNKRRGGKSALANPAPAPQVKPTDPTGTFIQKYDPAWLKRTLQGKRYQILTWRSVNVHFLRTVIHQKLGGAAWLKILYWLEEAFPRFFGENGQYPLIVIYKD
jgi:SAM-dependent methyltransferase